jgi:protein-S-isoprenylcysteine O-methyltransferase Ste14
MKGSVFEMSMEASRDWRWRDNALSAIFTPLLLLLIILTFFFFNNHLGIDALAYFGLFLWGISALMGIVPMLTFRRHGGVAEGDSYMRTTKLVDVGIYSVVRHPQATAGLVLVVALVCISQHPISLLVGAVTFGVMYADIVRDDAALVKRFGHEYEEYMVRVPRTNIVLGMARRIARER